MSAVVFGLSWWLGLYLLARDPRKLRDLRQRLTDNRRVKPLFDTAGYTRRLEAAFGAMHQRAMQGLAPEVFDVAVD